MAKIRTPEGVLDKEYDLKKLKAKIYNIYIMFVIIINLSLSLIFAWYEKNMLSTIFLVFFIAVCVEHYYVEYLKRKENIKWWVKK